MAAKVEPLAPGLYLDLPDEIYFGDEAVSFSGLKDLKVSQAEFWWNSPFNTERPEKAETDVLAQGKQFHCALLEPEKFQSRYIIQPGEPWRKNDTRMVCARSKYLELQYAVKVIKSTGRMDVFDRRFGYPEVVAVWKDELTGVMCRAKHDFFCWEWSVDYKTMESMADHFTHMQLCRNQYHFQRAHYLAGRIALRRAIARGEADFYGDFSDKFKEEFLAGENDQFIFVLQKRSMPFTTQIMAVEDDSIERTENDRLKLLMKFAAALEKYGPDKPWPHFSEGKVRGWSPQFGWENEESL